MTKEDIPEIIHAGLVLIMVVGFTLFTIIGVNEGWL